MENVKRNSKLRFMLLFLMLFSIGIVVISAPIQADPNFPLLMNKPGGNSEGYTITIRFKLSSDSLGLKYHQYLGVQFPSPFGTYDLYLDTYYYPTGLVGETSLSRISCALVDEDNNTISVTAVTSTAGSVNIQENYIQYCRLDDESNELLPNKSYTLTLTLNYVMLNYSYFLGNIGLFTATSNNSGKIIIDSLPVVGSLGLYSDWTAQSLTPTLDITATATTITNGPTDKLYPYCTFDISLSLKAYTLISPDTSNIIIKFPPNTVTPPNSVKSEATDTKDVSQAALTGQLGIKTLTDDSFEITGISEDIIMYRQFKLILSGWGSLDTNMSSNANLELWVFYKNTYSVVSYNAINLFYINPISVTFSFINHPENIDIFSGAAWPMKFSFTTNVGIPQGGYILIQQTNTLDKANKWNFSAATCDFSENSPSLVSQEISDRPICFPGLNDFNYENASSSSYYPGSSIIFKLPNMQSNTPYIFTVWGAAEYCGTAVDPSDKETSSRQFSFLATIYKVFDPTLLNIKRLTDATNQQILAQSNPSSMINSCWGTTDSIDYSTSSLMYKEISDFDIIQATNPSTCTDPSTCFSANVVTGSPTPVYLNASPLTNNMLLLRGNFGVTGGQKLLNAFPFPYSTVNGGNTVQSGRMMLQVSKGWVENGEYVTNSVGCEMTWNFLANGGNTSGDYALTRSSYTGGSAVNYISISATTLDNNNLVLPGDNPSTFIQIPSIFDQSQTDFSIVTESQTSCSSTCSAQFFIYTDCIKTIETTPTITSLYAYFDAQFLFQYMSNSSSSPTTYRIVRFIKMFPEYGVFNPTTNVSLGSSNMFTFHYTLGQSSTNNGMCIIQLNGSVLNTFISAVSSTTNTLQIFLFNLNILDTDYTTTSAVYPLLTQTTNTLSAYGWNNPLAISANFPAQIYYDPNHINTVRKIDFTYYLTYLSSKILITDPANFITAYSSTPTDVLIPTWCPYYQSATNQDSRPSITIQAMNINSKNMGISDIMFYQNNDKFLTYSPVAKSVTTAAGTANKSVLRFNRYSTSSSDSQLNIFPGTIQTAGISTPCSGYLFTVNNNFTLDSTNLQITINPGTAVTITPYYYTNVNAFFSFMGKVFNQLIVGVNSSPISISNTSSAAATTESSVNYVTGIIRPTVDTFYNSKNGYFSTLDKIGFFCSSSVTSDLNYMTNFVIDLSSSSGVMNFILDFNPDGQTSWTAVFGNDQPSGNLYSNDSGSDFSLKVTLPTQIPIGAYINLSDTLGNFTPNTICGIMNSSYALECNSDKYTSFTCPVLTASTSFYICCYNILLSSVVTLDTLSITFPLDSNIENLNSYISTDIYDAQSTAKSWTTGNQGYTGIDSLQSGVIKLMNYTYTNQESAIASLTMEIQLPRVLTRDSKISVSANFSSIAIPNSTPLCTVTTSSTLSEYGDYTTGDNIIESCTASNILNTVDSIIILTRRDIFQCGATISNSIRVTIWPVIAANLTSSNDNTYSINMYTRITGDYLIPQDVYNTFPTISYDTSLKVSTPVLSGKWNSLCNVVNIYPRLVDEYAFYDFEIDLFDNRASLINITANEVSIFFPYNEYWDLSKFNCVFQNSKVNSINCKRESAGILSIKFAQGFSAGTPNPIIRIFGIRNPRIDPNQNIILPCSVNYLDINGIRSNLITGSGVLLGGLTNPSANIGNLKVINSNSVLSNANPRTFGLITLKITFDTAQASMPSSILSPILIIRLPQEYKLLYFDNLTITAAIQEWLNNDSSVATFSSNINISSVNLYDNSIVIILADSSRSFPSSFRFWVVTLSNVPAPFEETTTSYFKICLTNSNFSVNYNIFTNLNTMATSPLTTPIDSFIQYTNGLVYKFDNTKFIIDIIPAEGASQTENNVIYITPGLYAQYYFQVRPNSNLLLTGSTVVSLVDNVFKTDEINYSIVSSTGKIGFKIGAPCSTAAGSYYINFTLSDMTNFLMIPPILAIVGEITPSIIDITADSTIPIGASSVIFYSLSVPNFDKLSIPWIGDSSNDSSSMISSAIIPSQSKSGESTFSIMNQLQTSPQIFTSQDPNACFTLSSNKLTISFSNNPYPIISGNIQEITSSFKYSNFETNPQVAENAVRFTFTPPADTKPVYFSCAIECFNSEFPSDLIIENTPTGDFFYSTYIGTSTAAVVFDFCNLMRGQRYKVQCVVQTTQSDQSQREDLAFEFNTIQTSSSNSNIATYKQNPTQCLKFTFSNEIGNVIKNSLLGYCQSSYTGKGGCVACMDNFGHTLPGVSTKLFLGCNLQGDVTSPFFQDVSQGFGEPYWQGNNVVYTVCAVQDIFCSSDINSNANSPSIIESMQTNLADSASFGSTLNMPPPPLLKVDLYTDENVPDLTSITASNVKTSSTGVFSITLTSSTPLLCYWLISPSTITTYTFDNIQTCNDSARCGITRINIAGDTISSDDSNLRTFSLGKYSLFLACYNDIPNPIQKSQVKVVYTFNINTWSTASNTSESEFVSSRYQILFITMIINMFWF